MMVNLYTTEPTTGMQMALPMEKEFLPIRRPNYTPGSSTLERFKLFHSENPHVARYLAYKALELRRKGIERWGIQALFVVLRYDYVISTSGEDFKIRNSFSPYYARLLMKHVPKLADFFETNAMKHGEPDL